MQAIARMKHVLALNVTRAQPGCHLHAEREAIRPVFWIALLFVVIGVTCLKLAARQAHLERSALSPYLQIAIYRFNTADIPSCDEFASQSGSYHWKAPGVWHRIDLIPSAGTQYSNCQTPPHPSAL